MGSERAFLDVVLSHDEKRAAFATIDADHGTQDVWAVELATGAMTRITNHPATDWNANWSPDDREIVFASDRAGQSTIYRTPADGSGEAQLVYRGDVGVFPQQWLPDGRVLFFRDVLRAESQALYAVKVGVSAPAAEKVLSIASTRMNGTAVAPDQQWVAYDALENVDEVYAASLSGSQRFKVSTNGGVRPFWRRDGRELYYVAPQGDIMAVPVSPGPVFGQPVRLLHPCQSTTPPSTFRVGRTFAMSADGQRVLAICETSGDTNDVNVALGWQSRLAAAR